jgi:hypothetical protein
MLYKELNGHFGVKKWNTKMKNFKAETEGLRVQGQPGLHSNILSRNGQKKKQGRKEGREGEKEGVYLEGVSSRF